MKIDAYKTERLIQVHIQPEGFWSSEAVTVRKSKGFSNDDTWESAEVNYGCGGTDGTLDSIDAAISKAIAIKQAAKIARTLNRRYT